MPYKDPEAQRAHSRLYYETHKPQAHQKYRQTREQLINPSDFWQHVDKTSLDGCWPWTGAKDSDGYGEYKGRRANRIAWELSNNRPLGHLRACHSCDNPPCCRPDHLFAGTDKQNTQDSVIKGRWTTTHRKLNEAQRLDIIQLYSSGQFTQLSLAKQYGVSNQLISLILCQAREAS